MTQPTSVRLPPSVKGRLATAAERSDETPSALAVRLIDEGLRMREHPGITFHRSPAHGRVAAVTGGPDVAELVDVLLGLDATGEDRLREAADWFGLDPTEVRTALGYYTAFRDEVDRQIQRRHHEAAELQGRYEAEQALLE